MADVAARTSGGADGGIDGLRNPPSAEQWSSSARSQFGLWPRSNIQYFVELTKIQGEDGACTDAECDGRLLLSCAPHAFMRGIHCRST